MGVLPLSVIASCEIGIMQLKIINYVFECCVNFIFLLKKSRCVETFILTSHFSTEKENAKTGENVRS